MAENINLKDDSKNSGQKKEPMPLLQRKAVKEAFRSMVDGDDVKREHVELLENILARSNVQFASVADRVSVDFSKFVTLLMTHDLGPLLEAQNKLRTSKGEESVSVVVISSDLLTDISNCERLVEEDAEDTNVLSGIFIYGFLVGLVLFLFTTLILQFIKFSINSRDLTFILIGCLVLMVVPIMIIVFEPYLRGMQKKHNEFFERLTHLFSGKL